MTAPRPRPRKASASPPAASTVPASVQASEVMAVEELARRLRWRRHSIRQARRLGLPTVRFGVRDYVIGGDVVAWFRDLRTQQQQQREDGDGNPEDVVGR